MYEGTYRKIAENASYLRRIHAQGNIENLELFDEPFKLALKVLDCSSMNDRDCAKYLDKNLETIKQVRSALGI
jgi:hypothetical protein